MDQKRLYGIRGATSVENTQESITENIERMCGKIFKDNNVLAKDIVSIQFTMTQDITEYNAATALRHSSLCIDISNCALFCSVEPQLKNSMPLVIRVLVTTYLPEDSKIKNVYLNNATKLRPDFVQL